MAITMQDIAKLAGVSRPVVSAVLNGNGRIKVAQNTRSRILELASKTGYTRNLSAQLINGKTTQSIAMFINPEFLMIYRDLQYQITLQLTACGYRVMQFPLLTPKTTPEIIQDAMQFGLDGIITIDCPNVVSQADLNTPMVSLMQNQVELDAGVDWAQGAYQITRHLLEQHGHRKLCMIGSGLTYQHEKIAGFRRACDEFGVSIDDSSLLNLTWNATFDQQLKRLLHHDGVTAFVASNDYIAVRLIGYLNQLGVRVPQDVAVTGYDGDMYAASGLCRVTTVRQPVRALADLTVKLMLRKIADKQCKPVDQPILLKPTLHLGDSCGCQTPPEKTIVWERAPTTLEGNSYVITPPPPELRERYDLSHPATSASKPVSNKGAKS